MRKMLAAIFAACIGYCVQSAAIAAPVTLPEFALYQGPDRNELLEAAAKKEGELTVYQDYPIMMLVEAAFTKKYGIKIKSWRADSESVLQRVISEARGSRNEVDVVQNNSPENQAARKEGLFQRVISPYQENLSADAVPAHKEWVGFTMDVFVAAFNTTKITKEEMPKTYQDLLNPKWKNKLSIEANDYAWFSNVVAALGDQQGRKLFGDIVATNGISFRKGHSLLTALVASGEVPVGLSAYSWTLTPLKAKGAPVDFVPIQPLIGQLGTVAVAKKAPHPAAALLFYDFLINEGQTIISDQGYVATSKKILSPFAKMPMKIIDPDQAIENQDKWFRTYKDVLVKDAK